MWGSCPQETILILLKVTFFVFVLSSVSRVLSRVPSHVPHPVSRAGWLRKKNSRELGARPLALFCGRLGFLQERTHDSLYKGTLV